MYDYSRQRAEVRVTVYSWLITVIILAIIWVVFIVYEHSNDGYDYIGYSLGLWFVGICLTINGLISTAWIYHLTKNEIVHDLIFDG